MELWINNPRILFDKERLIEFFPSKNYDNITNINCVTRFSIYSLIILSLLRSDYKIAPLIIFVLSLIYSLSYTENDKNVEKFDNVVESKITGAKYECTKPTDDNPYMNITMNEYTDNPKRDKACIYDDVREDSNSKFTKDLYKDISDVFGTNFSARQFYTNPVTTIPNAQGEFAQWLYGGKKNCKTNPNDCISFEDPRYKGYNSSLV